MTILCLCQEDNHRKLIPGYAQAFRARGIQFHCVDWFPPFDSPLEDLLAHFPERPSYIFQFESVLPLMPDGLQHTDIPTVCFQVDTYAYAERRIKWSFLFDHVAVFHPGYEARFRQAGHEGAFLLPHAVRREFFDGPEVEREFEVGWVGATQGPFYRGRHEGIPKLARQFKMNDWQRTYSLAEVAEVYRRSRVVVNIGRDDFPQDANLRVFEVLASGALLVTSRPSELTALGFEEGVHFAAYRQASEIEGIVRRYLGDEAARSAIAGAGRSKVMGEHTYDHRAEQILRRLEQFGGQKLAPARAWPQARAQLMYLDFYAAHGVRDCAARKFECIRGNGLRETLQGAMLLGKAWLKGRKFNPAAMK